MREIFNRLITGGLYVAVLLSAILLNSDAFDLLLMFFGLVCLYEFKKMTKLRGNYIFVAYLLLWCGFIYLYSDYAYFKVIVHTLLLITITVNIALLFYLFSKKEKYFSTLKKFFIGIFYIGSGCIFLAMIPYQDSDFAKFLIMGVFILIWVNDSFAYLIGKKIGKNKLFPSVSPKKTWEGFIGGLVFALIASYFIASYETKLNITQWVILTLVLVISGSLGDLLESKFKRAAGIKDSGALLPGHGGMLDRLDSLLFAAPFAYLTLNIFNYVS